MIFYLIIVNLFREERAEQSYNTLNTGSKEPSPKDPEFEAVKFNQLIKYEVDEGKIGFCGRNKVMSHFLIIVQLFKK